MIEIWQPRWHDRKVLIAKYKVCAGKNRIKFTKGTLKDKLFDIDGMEISKCPVETNGSISCYAVPLDLLRAVEEKESVV